MCLAAYAELTQSRMLEASAQHGAGKNKTVMGIGRSARLAQPQAIAADNRAESQHGFNEKNPGNRR
jgi:hypothetical protein